MSNLKKIGSIVVYSKYTVPLKIRLHTLYSFLASS